VWVSSSLHTHAKNGCRQYRPFSCNLALATMCMSTMSDRWSSHTQLLTASSDGQDTSAAQSTIDSPPLQRTLSPASLVIKLLEFDHNSTASAASTDFLLWDEVLVNVLELTSNELHNVDSSAGWSSWLTGCLKSVLITPDRSPEFDLISAFWRCDFFGRVKVLVSMPESGHSHNT